MTTMLLPHWPALAVPLSLLAAFLLGRRTAPRVRWHVKAGEVERG